MPHYYRVNQPDLFDRVDQRLERRRWDRGYWSRVRRGLYKKPPHYALYLVIQNKRGIIARRRAMSRYH